MKIEKNLKNQDNLVWARLKYCPYWPARIVEAPPEIGKIPRGKTCVLFFGTKEFGSVDNDKIENYVSSREKYISKGKGLVFKMAVKHMDEYLSDPRKFRSHAVLNSTGVNIPIKTERDVELRLGVKKEPRSSPQKIQNQLNNSSNWQKEKKNLVEKIVALKADSDKNLLALKKSEADYSALLVEKQKIEQTMAENDAKLSAQKKEIESELSKATCELIEFKTTNEKIVSSLKRERQLLLARIKQYKTGMGLRKSLDDPNKQVEEATEDEDYEVDAILKHKETRNGRQYLIRWKGYDSSEDTWEKEINLKCPEILNTYIRSIDMKRK